MKNQKPKSNRHELKKARELRNVVLTLLAVVVVTIAAVAYVGHQDKKVVDPGAQEIENYIRAKASKTAVVPGIEPVILYYRRPNMSVESFCCLGAIVGDKEYGQIVITAEHVFRNDLNFEQEISFRPLRDEVRARTYYLDQIIKTSKEMQGKDVVMATFGSKPKMFKPFSHHVDGEDMRHTYGDVGVFGKKISVMKSVVSGEVVPAFGYAKRDGSGIEESPYVLLEYKSRTGESGTVFIDEYGGLWFLHGGMDQDEEKKMITDYQELVGKPLSAACAVTGPFGGNYK